MLGRFWGHFKCRVYIPPWWSKTHSWSDTNSQQMTERAVYITEPAGIKNTDNGAFYLAARRPANTRRHSGHQSSKIFLRTETPSTYKHICICITLFEDQTCGATGRITIQCVFHLSIITWKWESLHFPYEIPTSFLICTKHPSVWVQMAWQQLANKRASVYSTAALAFRTMFSSSS